MSGFRPGLYPAPRSGRLTAQVHTGPMIDAGELRRTQPGTEGASLPANLSGTRTASIGPLWKVIRVHRAGSADGESPRS
ncbi:hypothetical protein FHS07_002380 [Microbacterium proteolyticum]|uniref:Uncharacterized protein n=1 Tax=Microbacterium proteolyticum TaxID=1572644 RepID=A0A7W5CJX4_9MICO|nr:hypothetical protein [Microbacterium proteolyticum]